jgi:hypothetical protein
VQRSIGLGSDPEICARTRQLLAEWQGARDPRRSPRPEVRDAWSRVEFYARSPPRVLQARCRAHFRPAIADPAAMETAYTAWRASEAEWRQLYGRRGRRRTGLV